jgi:hypothetical protein
VFFGYSSFSGGIGLLAFQGSKRKKLIDTGFCWFFLGFGYGVNRFFKLAMIYKSINF